MNTKIKNKIINHAKNQDPLECCGFIIEKNGDLDVIECENIAKDPLNNFKISSRDFLVNKHHHNILYIYHSHNEEENFSIMDKICSEESKIDMVLYVLKKNIFKHYTANNSDGVKYIGRSIDFHNTHCFDLVRKYYSEELNFNIKFPIDLNQTDKLEVTEKNLSEIVKYIQPNNMIFLQEEISLQVNDILLFNIDNYFHFAIYLGNNKILEQPRNAFSRIKNYCNYYNRKKIGIFRRK